MAATDSSSKRRVRALPSAGLLAAALLAAASPWAAAQSQGGPGWLDVADRYASALSAHDPAALQAVTTPELWALLEPKVAGAAGGCGVLSTADLVQHGSLLRPGYARVLILCRFPNGTEEFVSVTVKEVGAGTWKVCGGYHGP